MAGQSTGNTLHLTRSNVWSQNLKEAFEDELFAMKYVDFMTDFPDGDIFNIPSLGQAEVYDYKEGQAVQYTAIDTGNFTFTITEYKASATYITEKQRQDSFQSARLEAAFVPKQHRGLMESMEDHALRVGPQNQTAGDLNTINGGHHRFIGGGTNEVINLKDFALAKFALQKAQVPLTNLVAIVDPSVEITLKSQANLLALDSNPKWEGIVRDDMSTGTKFSFSVFGWDVYVSSWLQKNVNETIDGKTTSSGVANIFFSATSEALPFIGAVRQSPKVDSEYNKDFQREEYVTTSRWGMDLYRPESLVTVITDDDQVYA